MVNIFPKEIDRFCLIRLGDTTTFFIGNRMATLPACRWCGASLTVI